MKTLMDSSADFFRKTDFRKVSNEEINRVEYLLNSRPRKYHGGKTPLEVLLNRTSVAITYWMLLSG